MDAPISASTIAHRADRLRRVRLHVNNTMPPGRHRDDMHDQLDDEASRLASHKLVAG